MITETRLRKALDKLDRRQKGKAQGRPMSGLSIPADYYLAPYGRKARDLVRNKKITRTGAGR